MFGSDGKKENKESDIVGLIGKGMHVEGRLTFENTVRIDGNFKGEISSNGTLVVGAGAEVEAEIKVDTAIVTGEIKGVIEARTRVELQSPARLFGEIKTPNLIIGEGAVFEGNCVMLKRDRGSGESETVAYEGPTLGAGNAGAGPG